MAEDSGQAHAPKSSLYFAVALAVAAAIGWFLYFSEAGTSAALQSENSGFQQERDALNGKIQQLETDNRALAESLERSQQNASQLESEMQRLGQDRSGLEAELAQERENRERMEQELAQIESQQTSLSGQVSAANDEKQRLQDELEQAQARRQQLLDQIASVSADVEARQAELSASQQDMEQLNQELAQTRQDQDRLKKELSQTRQEQDQLKKQVAELSEQQQKEAQHFAELEKRLEQELNESRVEISQLKNRMLVISLTSEVLFSSGSAQIKPAGKEVLSVIAATLNEYPDRAISIEGHTDNVPIGAGSFYKSNWELASARALAALDYLREGNLVAPGRLKVVGHGEYSPIADNSTAEGRQLNRRIEIRLRPPGEDEIKEEIS